MRSVEVGYAVSRAHAGTGQARQRGQTLAEFALILLVLVLVVLGVIDFGRAVYARNVIANAAREGARVGVIDPENTAAISDTVATHLAAALGGEPSEVTVIYPYTVTSPFTDSQNVRVEVSYRFHPVTFLIGSIIDGGTGAGITLRARSTMRVER
jgi:hypothetical protein